MKVNGKSLQQLKERELNSYEIVMCLSSALIHWWENMYYAQTKQIISEYTNFRNAPIALIGRTWMWMSYKPKKEKKN